MAPSWGQLWLASPGPGDGGASRHLKIGAWTLTVERAGLILGKSCTRSGEHVVNPPPWVALAGGASAHGNGLAGIRPGTGPVPTPRPRQAVAPANTCPAAGELLSVAMMHVKPLDGPWSLCLAPGRAADAAPRGLHGRSVRATVPGCVHTDLLAAGLIDDPYRDGNDLAQAWIGQCDWLYATGFDLPAEALAQQRIELACDGLDTIATLTFNGVVVGSSLNMHTACRFDVTHLARVSGNELTVRFDSPLAWARAQQQRLGVLPATGNGSNPPLPHNFIRKMACNFGWDWGPALVTAGIWRPIRIEAYSGGRIERVRPLVTRADADRAEVALRVDTAAAHADAPATLALSWRLDDPDGRGVADGHLAVAAGQCAGDEVSIDRPRLWWPVGHGDAALYRLTVRLEDARGEAVQQVSHRIGLRRVELVTEPDARPWGGGPVAGKQGATFHLKVNGRRVYCKGANWIPDDCFPSRLTRQRYRRRIEQAREANMNMLRVWGGGIYESTDFYEHCDELGIMVWQDFCFACALYPEEEPFASLVAAEAADNVARLARHPSLVIWNGSNENIWGTFDWGEPWRRPRVEGSRTWGAGYYFDVLPEAVAKWDGTRPYWPSSPYSGTMQRHPNDNEYGNRHIWDVWHGPGEYRNYLAHYPRMSSEFGFHGPACWPTLAHVIPPTERRWDSPAMRHHNRNSAQRDGQEQTNERLADDFPVPSAPDRFDDWLYLAQVMQARALEMAVSWFRALSPWNGGALYWQLNDCWPASSWSAIDGQGRPKPLWYASRRFFAPRLITIKPRRVIEPPAAALDPPLAVYLHNDTGQPWAATLELRQLAMDGRELASHRQAMTVEPWQTASAAVPEAMAGDVQSLLLAEFGGDRATSFFRPDKQLAYPDPAFDAELSRQGDVHRLTITARSLLRDLCLFADRLDFEATVSDQMLTLVPGDRFTFEIHSVRDLALAELTAPPVFQCVNRFGGPAQADALAGDGSAARA